MNTFNYKFRLELDPNASTEIDYFYVQYFVTVSYCKKLSEKCGLK